MESPVLTPVPPPRVPSPASLPPPPRVPSPSPTTSASDPAPRVALALAAQPDSARLAEADKRSARKADDKGKEHDGKGRTLSDSRDGERREKEKHKTEKDKRDKTSDNKERKEKKDKAEGREARSKESNGSRSASHSSSHSKERESDKDRDHHKEREVRSAHSSPHAARHSAHVDRVHVERASSLDQSLGSSSSSGSRHSATSARGTRDASHKDKDAEPRGVRFRPTAAAEDSKSAASKPEEEGSDSATSDAAYATVRIKDDAEPHGGYSTVRIKDDAEPHGGSYSTVRIKDEPSDSSTVGEGFSTMRVRGSPPDSDEDEEGSTTSARSTATEVSVVDAYREPEAWELSIISFERGEWDPTSMHEDAWRKYRHHRPRLYSSFIKQPIDFSKHPPPPTVPPKPSRNTK